MRRLLTASSGSLDILAPAEDWRSTVEVAPENFAAGHFTLASTDWSGKNEGGRIMSSGHALGIDSGGQDNDAGGFQPDEFWSFRFDQPGQLMAIQFDKFSVEDADKAQLYIGNSDPITIEAESVKGGVWRPDRLLEFEAGETLRLAAVAPDAVDLEKAEQAYDSRMEKLAETFVGPLPEWQATSQWKVRGLNVIGRTDATHGGFIDFARLGPGETLAQQGGGGSVFLMEPGPMSMAEESSEGGSGSSMNLDVVLHGFEVDPDVGDESNFRFTYEIVDGPVDNNEFLIRIYRSYNGTSTSGQAIHTYVVPETSVSGTYSVDLPVDLGLDIQEDYYLMAVIEDAGSELTTNNNSQVFAGGAFRDDHTGIVYYHTEQGSTVDSIRIRTDAGHTIERYQGGSYQTIYTHDSDFASVHVRTHGGNDTIQVYTTFDLALWAFGGAGADNIYGGVGDDYLDGGSGLNTIYGRAGADFIYGGDETELYYDGYGYSYGSDFLFGEGGDDTIHGNGGPDWIDGGHDDDVIYGGDEGEGVLLDYYAGYGDYLIGGNGNDTIYGGAGGDIISGGDGNDILYGGSGNDKLYGSLGDDTYAYEGSGPFDTDTITESSGNGFDTLDFSAVVNAAGTGLALDLTSTGTPTVLQGESSALLKLAALNSQYLEKVIGTDFDDVVTGNALDNLLIGGAGDDILLGGDGNDDLQGDAGNDVLYDDTGANTFDWGQGTAGPRDALVVTTDVDENETLGDEDFGIGDLSLREALAVAALVNGDDVIKFDESLYAAGLAIITLSGSQLTISDDVTIEGPGADLLSISGDNASRVFNIQSGTTVMLHDLTITQGRVTGGARGGGILNGGTLTLDAVAVIGNTESGGSGGTGGAGGIYSYGPALTIRNSTVADNTATRHGGGLRVHNGTVEISNSTFSGNQVVGSNSFGGGIWVAGDNTVVEIVSSTITANHANSTGGGFGIYTYHSPVFEIHNTILAGNTAGASAHQDGNKPLAAASSYSLLGVINNGNHGATGDGLVEIGSADPGLTVLGDYGGPTQTHVPLPDSPAINAGDDDIATGAGLLFDQRGSGFQRILNGTVDIGATEAWVQELPGGIIEIHGGDGDDTIVITSTGIFYGTNGHIEVDVASALEVRVYAGDGDDRVSTDGTVTTPLRIEGGDGSDHLSGGMADDLLIGGDGDDTYSYSYVGDTGHGTDTIVENANEGRDTLDFSTVFGTEGVTLDLASSGTQTVFEEEETPQIQLMSLSTVEIENVVGTQSADVIHGDNLENELWGGGGNDELYGLGGADLLAGGEGDDLLFGGDAIDRLFGGTGADSLFGELGIDLLQGGPGIDTYETSESSEVNDPLDFNRFIDAQDSNTEPKLDWIPNIDVKRGDPVSFTVGAKDPDAPAQTLTYSLEEGDPTTDAIDAAFGEYEWVNTQEELGGEGENTLGGAHPVTVNVQDDGNPQLKHSQEFLINVHVPTIYMDDVITLERVVPDDASETGTVLEVWVTLSESSPLTVRIDYETVDDAGFAYPALESVDFTGVQGTLEFAPGETEKVIEIPIIDDEELEENELFKVVLSNPENALLIEQETVVTIYDSQALFSGEVVQLSDGRFLVGVPDRDEHDLTQPADVHGVSIPVPASESSCSVSAQMRLSTS